ncbi:putative acyl-CoA synthetase short-chain family member 3, mitochondrial isoform X2 [Apostichopus japonicus]|uniref:Acyl-CoA synthetase short-chain family member 3, mitochondrial n=1 Tax=Stichopus japonicus TaxID=307972 RepID=A0A2G8JDU0_STIJA|nr:putative acyl-CoA synthetase short-chain family member 3, mitochondrial isoform X2 [Apostichopus japonicus]
MGNTKTGSRFSRVLVDQGIQKGDIVLIYMPMVPQAVVAMLATARLGAIHSLVFGGFASKELSVRINHCKPKVIVSANVGIEPSRTVNYKGLLDAAIEMSDHKPKTCIIHNRTGCSCMSVSTDYLEKQNEAAYISEADMVKGRDLQWSSAVSDAKPHDCVPVGAMDPLYILYTSGTTGLPKAPVRPSAGYAVVLYWTMKHIYGMEPGEVWWAASDLGWVVGHSYICYAPLLHRNTTVLYEGKPVGTPDPGAFFRVIQDHNVTSMFTAPTALRAIRKEDFDGNHSKSYSFPKILLTLEILSLASPCPSPSALSPPTKILPQLALKLFLFPLSIKSPLTNKCMFTNNHWCSLPLTASKSLCCREICDHETLHWCRETFKVPVIDHWWQTETGWAITATCLGLGDEATARDQSIGKPVPGWDVHVLDSDNGQEVSRGQLGNIAVKLPLPPGSFSSLWQQGDRFVTTYFQKFPGYYDTMDAGIHHPDDFISINARVDDVINVAGHRISASAVEEAMVNQGDIVECATIGLKDSLKGHVPVGLCVLRSGVTKSEDQIVKEVIHCVRDSIGPVAAFKSAVVVSKLPRTRSGKISRQTVAAMANGEEFKIPPTIEDPTAYSEVREALQRAGIIS